MKRLLSLFLLAAILCLAGCNSMPEEVPEDFSFSLTFGTYGISSYDSRSGKLVKTTQASNPEDYITNYRLADEEKELIYEYIHDLDPESYPDEYNPYGKGITSNPSDTLILTVRIGDSVKTIKAEDIAGSLSRSRKPKGQKFLDTCQAIIDILQATEEWKALPDYEFYYD